LQSKSFDCALKSIWGYSPSPCFALQKFMQKIMKEGMQKCNSEQRELPSDLRKMKRNL
jgi:hypothetical protein